MHKFFNDWHMENHAKELAEWAHDGQTYKEDVKYTYHLHQVVGILSMNGYKKGHRARIVAWMHDILEDTDVPYELLESRFGLDIADDVSKLSRPEELDYDTYLKKIINCGSVVLAVKQADLLANFDASIKCRYDDVGRTLPKDEKVEARITKYRDRIKQVRNTIGQTLWIRHPHIEWFTEKERHELEETVRL